MLPHESEEYQDYLISETRKTVIPVELYDAFIPAYKENLNILDFGCGLGYLSFYYAEKYRENNTHAIYACDYQVEILDRIWKRITDNGIKKVTPFFVQQRSKINFPGWIPTMDYVFCSLSLSATDNPVDLLISLKSLSTANTVLHIVEWDKEKQNNILDTLYPAKYRLSLNQLQQYIHRADYDIIKTYKTTGPYNALTIKSKPSIENIIEF